MPKTKTITIEKPLGGLISAYLSSATGPTASLEGNRDQYSYAVAISPLRTEKFGDIAPGETFTAITDSSSYITGLVLNGDVARSNNAFVIQKGGRVIRLNTDGNSTQDYIAPIAHGGQTLQTTVDVDMIIVGDNASNEYVIATWTDDGGADAMVFRPGTTAFTDFDPDWFSQGNSANYLAPLIPHKITQGPDGNIYITNGQYIASATMGNGVSLGAATRNTQALNVGAGFYTVGITNYQDSLAIIGHKKLSGSTNIPRSICRVWLWKGFNPDPDFIYNIEDNFANGIFHDGETLWAFTNGRTNSSRLWRFNGQKFEMVFESGMIIPSANFTQGGVDKWRNSIHIASSMGSSTKGHIFSILQNGSVHPTMLVTNGTNEATEVGMFRNLYQGQIWIGVVASGNKIYYTSNFDGYYPNAELITPLYTRYDDGSPIRRGKIKKIHLWFSQFGTGASLKLSFFKGYDAKASGTDWLNKTLTNTTLGALKYYSFEVSIDDFDSFYAKLLFNHSSVSNTAAIVKRVVFECEEVDTY